jgi:hypothetical protein
VQPPKQTQGIAVQEPKASRLGGHAYRFFSTFGV